MDTADDPTAPAEMTGIEGGLRVAFGAPASLPNAERSVLARLAPQGVLPGRVLLLRDDPAGRDPLMRPRLAEAQGRAEGRYQVLGEIARGGVGVVLKGHDVDLGRDVAMKVLRDEHARNPDLIQRFVEEAQIGGQLQHPGIVPVYEMGLREDRRPYFTMKLIKGRTLALLLAERKDVAHDRRRFLSIFEAVCQTVAYAHARGVIHRDLKPANVMVGAFGEVLVVDWGMGKVLTGGVGDERRAKRVSEPETSVIATVRTERTGSSSVVGSVMGTPRYMPPEQARGAVEELDERADVFALGAILCEILTGKPPYTGPEPDALAQAVRGQVQGAFERLGAASVEADLASLVQACLSPAAEARPRDAGAVAKEVGAHLASVEERATAARTEAAEARVKAREERRRRRLSLALSGAVLALVLLGGGGWYFVEQGRRTRAEEASRVVGRAVEEGTTLRAAAAAGDDLGLWREAVAAARSAEAVARSESADEATRARAARLAADVEREHQSASLRAEEEARDDAMVGRLDEIRMAVIAGRAASKVQDYAQVFRDYGIDLETGDRTALAQRIRSSRIALPLVLALDQWAAAAARPPKLLAFVDAADPDPWRRNLRAANTLEALRELAGTADVDATPVQSLLMLAYRLGQAGDTEGAFALSRRVQQRHPGDLWANFLGSYWADQCSPPHAEDAARYAAAMVALRPENPVSHEMAGSASMQKGDFRGAIAAFREEVRLMPGDATALACLGGALAEIGDVEGGLRELREATRLEPGSAFAHVHLGFALRKGGDLAGALAAYREATRLEPANFDARAGLAGALRDTGDATGAEAEFRESIRGKPDGAQSRSGLGLLLLSQGDKEGAIPELREAVRLDPGRVMARRGLAVALADTGDLEGAIAVLEEGILRKPDSMPDQYLLAVTLAGTGRFAESLVAHRAAQRIGSPDPDMRRRSEVDMRDAERFRALEGRLDGVLRGTDAPADAAERALLGWVAYTKARFAAAAALYAKAMEDDPALVAAHRYNAACAAARAGAGDGEDAPPEVSDRARLRRQAIDWLRGELSRRTEQEPGSGDAATRSSLRQTLRHWERDRDLAAVRDEAHVALLPAAEQEACRSLWRDVAAQLAALEERK